MINWHNFLGMYINGRFLASHGGAADASGTGIDPQLVQNMHYPALLLFPMHVRKQARLMGRQSSTQGMFLTPQGALHHQMIRENGAQYHAKYSQHSSNLRQNSAACYHLHACNTLRPTSIPMPHEIHHGRGMSFRNVGTFSRKKKINFCS